MKIEIPKVIVQVSLAEYAPELQGSALHVWVNPSMAKLNVYNNLVTELQEQELTAARKILMPEQEPAKKDASAFSAIFAEVGRWLKVRKEEKPQGVAAPMLAWYAEIWSQGPQDTHWTVDELRMLEQADPSFLSWMIARTWQARAEHMEQKKKV